jgi:hypothetical protein
MYKAMPCTVDYDSAVECLHCEVVGSAVHIIEAIHITGHFNNG